MRCSHSHNRAGYHHFAQYWVVMLLAAALVVTGCNLPQWAHNGFKVGPNYGKPVAAIADDWIDSNDAKVLDSTARVRRLVDHLSGSGTQRPGADRVSTESHPAGSRYACLAGSCAAGSGGRKPLCPKSRQLAAVTPENRSACLDSRSWYLQPDSNAVLTTGYSLETSAGNSTSGDDFVGRSSPRTRAWTLPSRSMTPSWFP